MPRIGPFSTAEALSALDGRSREARLLKIARKELTDLIGGNPNVAQRELIAQASWMKLRIALMNERLIQGENLDEPGTRQFQGWCNAYARLLRQLSDLAPKPSARRGRPSIAEHLARLRTAAA